MDTRHHAPRASRALIAFALAFAAGCTTGPFAGQGGLLGSVGGQSARPRPEPTQPSPATEQARTASQLDRAEQIIEETIAAREAPFGPGDEEGVRLLIELAEIQVRQGRYKAAEATATRALVIADPAGPLDGLSQRAGHYRLGRLYEAIGRDEDAERHYRSALDLCVNDPDYAYKGSCNTERDDLIELFVSQGRYRDAEPLVLKRLSLVQQVYGAHDLHLAQALGEASLFYSRQGKHQLAQPLFTRGLRIWSNVRDESLDAYITARVEGLPNPLAREFTDPLPGHFPLIVPYGFDQQPINLLKLNRQQTSQQTADRERELWSEDRFAEGLARARYENAAGGSELERVLALQTLGYVYFKKGRYAEAESYYRQALERMVLLWPGLDGVARRRNFPYYLDNFTTLAVIARAAGRQQEAARLYDKALAVAAQNRDRRDAVYLDLIMELAATYREAGDLELAEATARRYLEEARSARGEDHPDYAWGLRALAYITYAKGDLERSQRIEAQAREIWTADQADLSPY